MWLDERLRSGDLPRKSFSALAKQHFDFGRVQGTWWARDRRPLPRQLILLAMPPAAVAGTLVSTRTIGWGRTALVGVALAVGVEAIGAAGPRGGVSARVISTLGIAT